MEEMGEVEMKDVDSVEAKKGGKGGAKREKTKEEEHMELDGRE